MPSMQSPEPPERCFTRWSRPRNPGAARPRPRAPEPELRRASVSPEAIPMRLAEKLNLRKGMKVRVVGKAGRSRPRRRHDDELQSGGRPARLRHEPRRSGCDVRPRGRSRDGGPTGLDRLPEAGQLGTDLNRDILWRHLLKRRIQGVRQIAIDDVWSALRFRPEK